MRQGRCGRCHNMRMGWGGQMGGGAWHLVCTPESCPRPRVHGESAMLDQLKPYLGVVGRLLLAQIFLLSGIMKIVNWSKTADEMAGHGMFAVPLFLVLAIL